MNKVTKNEQPELSKSSHDFHVVGVGASAGGLSAFMELLKNIPADANLTFIIIQHLLPTAKSNLSEILSGKTNLKVEEVKGDTTTTTTIEPGHVYVIPPNKNIVIEDNELKLLPREHAGSNLSINEFFVSLAKSKGQNAIGVILSGTGSDGTLGMKSIREVGGITFVQDKTAEFSAMPNSVIAAGLADYIFNPEEIAKMLVRISRDSLADNFKENNYNKNQELPRPELEDKDLHKILQLLLGSSDIDFTYYKHGTLKRRITRRMHLKNLKNFREYAEYLQKNPEEVESLYQDILIKVTSFFRDQGVFDFLKIKILPKLLKQAHQSIRIWVPGCSTGEEVYSLAITLAEFMEENKKSIPIQIFGTDLSETALNTARHAKYSDNIRDIVPPILLNKFFTKVEGGYQINSNIRSMCVFAKHNMLSDTPFSKMDIVSCRNVLIYLDSVLQKKAFPIFHYALNPKGFLILGTAETAGSFQDLFSTVNRGQKIYLKKSAAFRPSLGFPNPNPPMSEIKKQPEETSVTIEKKADNIVLSRHAPAGVIINDDLVIIQFRGDVTPYLKPASGKATFDLIRMARKSLLARLLEMLSKAKKSGVTSRSTLASMGISIEVIPLDNKSARERHYLILFEDNKLRISKNRKIEQNSRNIKEKDDREAEEELSSTIEQLQTLVETRDTTNEELRSANEEVMSANEELQSTNEELETTKEELQSTNEELLTLATELQKRNDDLKSIEDAHKKMVPKFDKRGEDLYRKNEFISILGHELRNPLAPILHTLELAKLHGIKDPEVEQMMDVIERQTKLLNDIVRSLLDSARAMSGKIRITLKPVDFNILVDHAIETVQPLMRREGRILELHPLDKSIPIFLDPLRIEQVIINLLSNAIKYTASDGKITITVKEENEVLILSVKDNGVGISKEMLPRIFDLFSQTNQSRASFKGGLGVGLMLARTIAELHGGSLTALSPGPDKGSEFILRLPIKQATGDTGNGPPEEIDIKNLKLDKKKVILVDDNVTLADVFGKVLSKLNQEVKVVYDGASALEIAHSYRPDIIFIDIVMPYMSGHELVKILKKDPNLEKTKFIALSGFGEEYRYKSQEAGFDDHLIKPVGIVELKNILSSNL